MIIVSPNAPAYPVSVHENSDGKMVREKYGMPIRLEIASRIMAGFAANSGAERGLVWGAAETALKWTDALLHEYNKGQES